MNELVSIVQKFINQFSNRSNEVNAGEKQISNQTNVSHQVYTAVPEHKLAVTISDDDWNSFLQAPSIIDSNKKEEKSAVELPKDLIFDFNFGNEAGTYKFSQKK